jgi:Zn ribbon nucleic-acid-binding protein
MSKYVKVCDCPADSNYDAFVAGKFRKVETKNGSCVHCGYIAMDMKESDINKRKSKKTDIKSQKESQEEVLTEEWVLKSLDSSSGGDLVYFDELS